MEDRFELTRDELNHIYWALRAYRDEFFTIYKDRKEANESLYLLNGLINRIWCQLSNELREIIDPERNHNETWETVNHIRKEFEELRKYEKYEKKCK